MSKNHVFITAEIGINHNGDLELAKQLIDWAYLSGCDAVKFQKRTIDKVYTSIFKNVTSIFIKEKSNRFYSFNF